MRININYHARLLINPLFVTYMYIIYMFQIIIKPCCKTTGRKKVSDKKMLKNWKFPKRSKFLLIKD